MSNNYSPLMTTSSILSDLSEEGKEEKQNTFLNKGALGFIVLLMSSSMSIGTNNNFSELETHSSIFTHNCPNK